MSDSEQDGIPITSPATSDAPAPEAVPAEMITAPPVIVVPPASADAISADSVEEEAPVAPPAPLSDSAPPADTPAEIPVPEHTNILENVGTSVEPTETASSSSATVPDNSSSPFSPPIGSSAPAVGTTYAALLSLRDKAQNAIQFRRQARLEKIIALAEKKGAIGNDDVEKLLRVSDATVSRYLSALVQEGKLNRIGSAKVTQYSLPIASNGAV